VKKLLRPPSRGGDLLDGLPRKPLQREALCPGPCASSFGFFRVGNAASGRKREALDFLGYRDGRILRALQPVDWACTEEIAVGPEGGQGVFIGERNDWIANDLQRIDIFWKPPALDCGEHRRSGQRTSLRGNGLHLGGSAAAGRLAARRAGMLPAVQGLSALLRRRLREPPHGEWKGPA
jgi:hypothetical protein